MPFGRRLWRKWERRRREWRRDWQWRFRRRLCLHRPFITSARCGVSSCQRSDRDQLISLYGLRNNLLNASSSSLFFSQEQCLWSSSRSRARCEAWSRIVFTSLIKSRFADLWISARLCHITQWLRSAWFSARRREISDEEDGIGMSSPSSSLSGEWASMYSRRMLGVTNARKLGGTILKFTGAANIIVQQIFFILRSPPMLTDIINRTAKWTRMKISKMFHCTDGFYNAVGAEDMT